MTISAVIITFNEEKNIARCLASLQGIVHETIVVDSFSTDNTQEICKMSDAKFFQRKWAGYSDQKNYANSLASGDYILSIDADEVLSPELQMSLKQLKPPFAESYSMNRLTNYCGHWIRHCGWYPDRKTRLFRKDTAYWSGHIHEELIFREKVHPVLLRGDLHHYSYHSISDHLLQVEKFTTLTAEKAHMQGKRSNGWIIFFKPCWMFLRSYLFKGGFLDGFAGYQVCKISAFATFIKYSKLQQRSCSSKTDKQS